MKNWKGDEHWKRKEPGSRLSQKAQESEWHFQKQREKMERDHGGQPQQLKIICEKNLLLPYGLFKSFVVKVRYPLSQEEFEERMKAAFPELSWEDLHGSHE